MKMIPELRLRGWQRPDAGNDADSIREAEAPPREVVDTILEQAHAPHATSQVRHDAKSAADALARAETVSFAGRELCVAEQRFTLPKDVEPCTLFEPQRRAMSGALAGIKSGTFTVLSAQ